MDKKRSGAEKRQDIFESTERKPEFSALDLTVILIFTETSGNIGSVCRVMKNFGFSKLILFHPLCNPLDNDAHGFAMHGDDILNAAEIIRCDPDHELAPLQTLFQRFDIVIGTSAKGITYQNIKRVPVFLHEMDFSQLNGKSKVALVFGRESTGLSNEQILLTDFCLKIHASESYPTLNLSQAVGICLYHFYLNIQNLGRGLVIPASKQQKDRLTGIMENIAQNLPLDEMHYEKSVHAFKNLIGRAFLSWKESNLIYRILRKIDYILAGKVPISAKQAPFQPREHIIPESEDQDGSVEEEESPKD
jgi:TrmH family RNA methyltransferase